MVAVNYLWNPINDNIVREFDDAGSVVAEYTTEPDLYGNVVSQFRGGQTNYLHSDALGSTTELTNDAGSVTDAIRYSAFGEVTQRTGTTEIPFQYIGKQGYYRDQESGNYLIRRRVLAHNTGCWLSPDPRAYSKIALKRLSMSTFSYGYNNPLMFADASGTYEVSLNKEFPWGTHLCGAYRLELILKAKPKKFKYPLVVIQRIRISLALSYCDCDPKKPDPPGTCSKVVCTEAYDDCEFFELVTIYRDEPGQRIDEKAAIDSITSRPYSIPGKCPNTKGREEFAHDIRVFEDNTGDIEDAVNTWKGGVQCFGVSVGTNKATTRFRQWNTATSVDDGRHEGLVHWDCCSPKSVQVLRIITSDEANRSGVAVLAYRHYGPGKGPGATLESIDRRKGNCDHIMLGDSPP